MTPLAYWSLLTADAWRWMTSGCLFDHISSTYNYSLPPGSTDPFNRHGIDYNRFFDEVLLAHRDEVLARDAEVSPVPESQADFSHYSNDRESAPFQRRYE